VGEGGLLVTVGAIVLAIWVTGRMRARSSSARSGVSDSLARDFKTSAVE
jgi:hypothetical protein